MLHLYGAFCINRRVAINCNPSVYFAIDDRFFLDCWYISMKGGVFTSLHAYICILVLFVFCCVSLIQAIDNLLCYVIYRICIKQVFSKFGDDEIITFFLIVFCNIFVYGIA